MIEFKVHSFIDVITNSSSEIYVINKNKIKENIEDIIESLTFLANTDVDYRDIFEISISNEFDGVKVHSKYEDYEDDEDPNEFYKNNKELAEKIVRGLKAIFDLEYVDRY